MPEGSEKWRQNTALCYGGSLRTWCELFLFRFREILSRFREILFRFREILSRFREIISRFREIISRFREIISRFREIVFLLNWPTKLSFIVDQLFI